MIRSLSALCLSLLLCLGCCLPPCLTVTVSAQEEASASDVIYVCDLPIQAFVGHETLSAPGVDANIYGNPLVVDNVSYAHGLSTHPTAPGVSSTMVFDISDYTDTYHYLTATAGKDSSTNIGAEGNEIYKCKFLVHGDGVCLYESEPLTWGGAVTFTVEVTGVKTLTLEVIDCGVFAYLTFDFCDIRLHKEGTPPDHPETPIEPDVPLEGDIIYLSDMRMASYSIHNSCPSPSTGISLVGTPLIVDGVTYTHGISTHPVAPDTPSEIVYDISAYTGTRNLFSVTAGKDGSTDLGEEGNAAYPCAFYIKADGRYVYTSGSITYGGAQTLTLDVTGVQTLTLGVVNTGAFAWLTFDFCDARLYAGDAPETQRAPAAEHADLTGALYLSDLSYSDFKTFGTDTPGIDKDVYGGDIVIANARYDKGISLFPGATEPAYITYDVSAYSSEYTMFYAVCGKDDFAHGTATNLEMWVYADGQPIAQTQAMAYGDAYVVYANIRGVKELELRVGAGTDSTWWDMAAFGDACLLKKQVKNVTLVSTPYEVIYREGDTLNPYGGILRLEYQDDLIFDLNVTVDMLSVLDTSRPGEQVITITYEGYTFEYTVTVLGEPETAPETQPETSSETDPDTQPETDIQTEPVTVPETALTTTPATQAPTTTTPDATTDASTTPVDDSGCRSAVALIIPALAMTAAAVWLKKRRQV